MINDFYRGETVFLTGVTGFLGKAVLEKLLRSCPSVKEVCVLLRPKRGVETLTRLEEILQSPMFGRVRSETPEAFKKVRPIAGDIEKDWLGISESDRSYLINHVSVVIHSAACVKFNGSLISALNTNYKGTGRVLELAQESVNLKVVVYVSTAYANCHRNVVSEEVLRTECDIGTLESMSKEVESLVTPQVLEGRPNTYTYSKAAAESLLMGQQFPIAIVRPTIIGATWKDTVPGFVDCYTGATGLIASIGKGLITHLVAREELVIDVVPLDVVTNVVVASAWHASSANDRDPVVINCCSGNINPMTYGELRDYTEEGVAEYPLEGAIRSPSIKYQENPIYFSIVTFLFTFIPFLIADSLALLTGSKPKLLKLFWRVHEMCSSLQFFRTHEWNFERKNLRLLESEMSAEDRETFYVDLENLNWREYIQNYVLGIKAYLFHEDIKRIRSIRQQQQKMYLVEMGIYGLILTFACLFIADALFMHKLFFINETLVY